MTDTATDLTASDRLLWQEERSEHLGTSSFICSLVEGDLRIGHHRKGDDLVMMRFKLPMEPEFSGYAAWKAARDAAPPHSRERDRLDAMMLGNSDIGYFATADDAMRLLEVARLGTSATAEDLLRDNGFVAGNVLHYPEQRRTVAIYLKRVKTGHFSICVENDTDVHLTYQGRNALGHRNLMNVSFAEASGTGNFTALFWPSFVTTPTAMLMAVTLADDYLAQGRTCRRKRSG
ncbi:MAG: hypothetical protein DI537_10670 [Stutzerimonas stutzeri]|nr:MAG: hypothetical protein DI537_10670 [Stutzerimonas stutzeri]